MLAIKNATIVLPDHYIPCGTILVDGDKIVDFGKKIAIPEGSNHRPYRRNESKGENRGSRTPYKLHLLLMAENDQPSCNTRTRNSSCTELNAPDQEDPGLHQRRDRSSLRVLGKGWILKSQ